MRFATPLPLSAPSTRPLANCLPVNYAIVYINLTTNCIWFKMQRSHNRNTINRTHSSSRFAGRQAAVNSKQFGHFADFKSASDVFLIKMLLKSTTSTTSISTSTCTSTLTATAKHFSALAKSNYGSDTLCGRANRD